ncbi:MAG: hypothetical protein FWD36_05455 [Treponema sp.]|nr:hypothetical protein [Treponema sp.]
MSDKAHLKPLTSVAGERLRQIADVLVVFICLSVALGSFYLFYHNLFQTLSSQNAEAVGTVTVKYNSVQRRMGDRVLWERLLSESPVYAGDLIRVADHSGAILHFDGNDIDLDQNTLIRIQFNKGAPQIELASGSLSLSTGAGGGNVLLVIDGKTVEAESGTILNAAANEEGMILQVSGGAIRFTEENGQVREAVAGTVIALDTEGGERIEPAAMILRPRYNTRFLKSTPEPLDIAFSWDRINLEPDEPLRLEIAEDRNFSRIAKAFTVFNAADVVLDAGIWHWRLLHQDFALYNGRIIVMEALGPSLLSPAMDSLIRYRAGQPELRFQWSTVEEAAYYLLKAGRTPTLEEPHIETHVWGTSFINSSLGQGTWFWQVQPVFPPNYEGSAGVSSVATFRLEKNEELAGPVLKAPAPGAAVDITLDRSDFYFSWERSNEAVAYTIQISENQNMSRPVVSQTVQSNFYVYGKYERTLRPGQYFWTVFFIDEEDNLSLISPIRSFVAVEGEIIHRAVFPPDGYTISVDQLQETQFTWRSNLTFERRFQVSSRPDFSRLEIDELVTGEVYQSVSLSSGDWYWRIFARDMNADYLEFVTPVRRLSLTRPLPLAPVMEQPRPGSQVQVISGHREEFRWQPVSEAEQYRLRLYAAADLSTPVHEQTITRNTTCTIAMDSFADGTYYWTVQVLPNGDIGTEQFVLRRLQPVTLASPVQGATISGLTALRQQTVFQWNSTETVGNARFILSRSPNPSQGRPAVNIPNPGRVVRLDGLEEGTWYWTVEAQTPEGLSISAAYPRQLQVLPIPLLPAPENRWPPAGYRFGADELRAQRNLVFNWSAVAGANAYIFSLFQGAGNARRHIIRTDPQTRTNWTLTDFGILQQGTFIWQVEAIHRAQNGTIEQRGTIVENSFILDVPLPGQVQVDESRSFYGN